MRSFTAFLLCLPLSATTYFVSNSGSDSNNGTSTGTPWQTIAHVNSQTRSSGDSVLFQSGGVWRTATDAQLLVNDIGASGNPITYGSYGSGSLPRISSSVVGTFTLSTGKIYVTSSVFTDPEVVTVNGIPGTRESTQGALVANNEWFYNSATFQIFIFETSLSGLTIEYGAAFQAAIVQGSHVVLQNIQFDGGFYNLIDVLANSSFPSPTDITLASLTLLNPWQTCINIDNPQGNTTTLVAITNNKMQSCGLNGFQAQLVNFLTVTGNHVSYSGTQVGVPTSSPIAGIHAFGRQLQVSLIANNLVDHMGYTLDGSLVNTTNAEGIHLDTVGFATTVAGANNVVVNNVVHDNPQNNIQIEVSRYVLVSGNVIYNVSLAQPSLALALTTQDDFVTPDGNYENSDNVIVGNTIYNNTLGIQMNGAPSGRANTCLNNTVQNNIFYGGASVQALWAFDGCNNDGTQGTGNVYTYNYVGANRTSMLEWATTFYSTLASWEAATGNCGTGGCSHSSQSDPQFVNAIASDFRLSRGSPALTAGNTSGVIGAVGVVQPSLLTGASVASGTSVIQ